MSLTTGLGYTPIYQINYDGQDITGQFNDRVTMIKITSRQVNGMSDQISISLDDRDWAIATPDVVQSDGAATLQVNLGYAETGLYDQGTFVIDRVLLTGMPKTMTIEGSSQGFLSSLKSPLITSYTGKTVSDIVGAVAQMASLGAVVDPELGSKTVEMLNQHASSMHLLQQLGKTYDAVAQFQDGNLAFVKRGSGLSALGTALSGFALYPADFGTWEWEISARTAYSKVRAAWFDKTKNQPVWLTNSTTTAQNAVGAPYMIKHPFNTQDEAQSAADSMMGSLNRQLCRGTITLAKGHPGIHGGTPFTVNNMKADALDGSYFAYSVSHTFTKDAGIISTIEFMSPTDGNDFSDDVTQTSNIDTSSLPPTTPTDTGSHYGDLGLR